MSFSQYLTTNDHPRTKFNFVDLSVPSVVPMIGSPLPPIYVAYRTLRISYRFLLLFSTLQSPHRSSVPLTGSLSAWWIGNPPDTHLGWSSQEELIRSIGIFKSVDAVYLDQPKWLQSTSIQNVKRSTLFLRWRLIGGPKSLRPPKLRMFQPVWVGGLGHQFFLLHRSTTKTKLCHLHFLGWRSVDPAGSRRPTCSWPL